MGLMSFLTGGSKQKSKSTSTSQSSSQSGNVYKDYIQNEFNPTINSGRSAMGLVDGLFGRGDMNASRNAFDNFKESAGYDFALGEGSRALDGSQAARGMLRSGSTLKALEKYRSGLSDQYMSRFLDTLLKQQTSGLQAGGLIAGAGQYSNSTGMSNSTSTSKGSSSNGGFLDVLKSVASIAGGLA